MAKKPEGSDKSLTIENQNESNGELADEIVKRVGSLVPKNQKAKVVAQVMAIVQQERFSGPIAHPKHLREYENILPGAADRIISMAEHNLKHNQDFQMGALNADIKDSGDGRKYGFAALCLLILGAIFSTWLDNTALALAFLGTGALGVIGLFIRGRKETEDS